MDVKKLNTALKEMTSVLSEEKDADLFGKGMRAFAAAEEHFGKLRDRVESPEAKKNLQNALKFFEKAYMALKVKDMWSKHLD